MLMSLHGQLGLYGDGRVTGRGEDEQQRHRGWGGKRTGNPPPHHVQNWPCVPVVDPAAQELVIPAQLVDGERAV